MRQIIFGTLAVVLFLIGVWLSGWEPRRGEQAVLLYISGICFASIGATFGLQVDSQRKRQS